MVLGRIIGRVLPKFAAADSTAARVVTTVATDSAAAARTANGTREAIAAARKAANPFDYGRKVFALPEGQVTTRSGRVYTRSMGSNGERIYTDASGNQTTFNGLIYKQPGYNESAIYRTTPDGGCYSLRFSTGNLRFNRGTQKVCVWNRKNIGGACRNAEFEINSAGRVVETQYDHFNPYANPSSSGILTRYGCPRAGSDKAYGWLDMRWTTEAPPQWTSIGDFTRGL